MTDILDLLDQPDDDRSRSLAELDDVELQAHILVYSQRRDELALSDPVMAGLLHDMLLVAVDERDRRVKLARQVDDAMAESLGIGPGTTQILRTAASRRNWRRRR